MQFYSVVDTSQQKSPYTIQLHGPENTSQTDHGAVKIIHLIYRAQATKEQIPLKPTRTHPRPSRPRHPQVQGPRHHLPLSSSLELHAAPSSSSRVSSQSLSSELEPSSLESSGLSRSSELSASAASGKNKLSRNRSRDSGAVRAGLDNPPSLERPALLASARRALSSTLVTLTSTLEPC